MKKENLKNQVQATNFPFRLFSQHWSCKNKERNNTSTKWEETFVFVIFFLLIRSVSKAIFIFLFWFSCVRFVVQLYSSFPFTILCNVVHLTSHTINFSLEFSPGFNSLDFPWTIFWSSLFSSHHRVSTMFILFFFFFSIFYSHYLFFCVCPNSFRYEHDPGDEILDDIH